MKMLFAGVVCAVALGCGKAVAYSCGDTDVIYNLYDMMSEIQSENGPGTIGPRRLVTNQTSEIVAFTDKRFIQPHALDVDQITIKFTKEHGSWLGGGVVEVVCATDESGNVQKLDEVKFSGGRRNIGDQVIRSYSGLKGKRLSIHAVGIGAVGSARIRFDLLRNPSEGQPWVPDTSAPTGPVPGFADVHVHQTADLAYSKGWYWGSHQPGDLMTQVTMCSGDNHGTLEPLGIEIHELGKAHLGETSGYPDFINWPRWNDIKHQQVTSEWLKDAHERGLTLMVASVVANQTLAAGMIASGNHDNRIAPFDMESVRHQITELKKMDESEDWFEIVLDPWHARRAIAEGKLAVILAIEASNLFPESDGPWREQLYDVYDMGVRALQIAHQTNNDFSGAAYHQDIFEIVTQLKAWYTGDVEYAEASDGVHNDIGMSARGYQLLDEMIRLNMIIDMAHLPLKSQREIYQVVSQDHNYYPLFNSHTRIDELLYQEDRDILNEHVTTDETLEFYRATGGVIGLRTGLQRMKDYPASGVANNCDGSSRSIAQFYRYAADRGVKTAFASDFNGFIEMNPPRFGADACATAPDEPTRLAQAGAQGAADPNWPDYVQEYNEKGTAHIGLLPALLWDLNEVGADVTDLETSSESMVAMWERIYDPARQMVQ
ncbi:membrane dipeptidase [Microbulbifer sp. HZ11]|uniref:membrane dipeptidase n=1 Tax=Microbulbifer sp. HZ11 TaxID=1453501 RepID=UPI0005BBF037|nr:membrane dipeptidase [Microbulbifer sp. HZ11]